LPLDGSGDGVDDHQARGRQPGAHRTRSAPANFLQYEAKFEAVAEPEVDVAGRTIYRHEHRRAVMIMSAYYLQLAAAQWPARRAYPGNRIRKLMPIAKSYEAPCDRARAESGLEFAEGNRFSAVLAVHKPCRSGARRAVPNNARRADQSAGSVGAMPGRDLARRWPFRMVRRQAGERAGRSRRETA
jgi:hypothetical protein